MYDISMASLCTWKNEAFEACVVMVTLPDRVPVLPVKNYPYPIPEESATRHSPTSKVEKLANENKFSNARRIHELRST